jgi:transcriptional regulator with XRE-family HTH domain
VNRNLEKHPDLQGEVWMDVVGFEGLYKVSNIGRVRSSRRGTIMIPHPLKDGYLRIRLRKEGKDFSFLVHRLVAMAFIPNPNNYDTINHKDFNTQNNCVENLEWCTQKYNNKYSRDAGHYHYSEKAREAAKRNRKISDELAIKIFDDYKKGMKQADLASKYDVTRAFVCRLVHGRCRTEYTNQSLEKDLKIKFSDDEIISMNESFKKGISLKSIAERFNTSSTYVGSLVFGRTERSRKLVEKGLMTTPKVEKPIPQKELYKDEILRFHSEGMSLRKIRLVLGIKGHGVVAEVIKEFKDKNNE